MDRVAVIVPLPEGESQALAALTALAHLPETPAHDVVLVDTSAGALDALLARVQGDVQVLRATEPTGVVAAFALGAAHTDHDVLAVLSVDARPQGDWLAPLVAATAQPSVAAATSAVSGADGVHALAVTRTQLAAAGAHALAAADLTGLALALAAHGAVRPVPHSIVTLDVPPVVYGDPHRPLELSIVIPTLEATSERVRGCLLAIAANTTVAHEVIVMHNGPTPQGFAAPVNAGIRAARAPYVVVMNDDVEPLPGWWEPLRAALDQGASVAFPYTLEGFNRPDFAAWCFGMTRDTIARHSCEPGEFFDPRLVVHFQDTDLMVRLQNAGEPPVQVMESTIRHGLSQTLGTKSPELSRWLVEQVARDQEVFVAKQPEAFARMKFAVIQ